MNFSQNTKKRREGFSIDEQVKVGQSKKSKLTYIHTKNSFPLLNTYVQAYSLRVTHLE